jgi:sulfur-carrier protein
MVHMQFYSLLRLALQREKLDLPAGSNETIGQLLQRVQERVPTPFLHKLLDDQGGMHAGTIIMVNRRNILHLNGLDTPVKDGDQVALFPPGAGG